jgi:MFS family permease
MSLAAGMAPEVRLLLIGCGLRACVDGYVAVLLPAYQLALGYDIWHVGLLSTATLLGLALAPPALGAWGHRAPLWSGLPRCSRSIRLPADWW